MSDQTASTAEQLTQALHTGASWLARNCLDDAEACFRTALSHDPANAEARAALASIRPDLEAKNAAIALHQRGAFAEAGAAYRALLARRPNYPEILNNLGVLTLQQGDAAGAARLLQQAVERKPLADGWANLGAALKRQGRHTDAIAAYEQAIALAPHAAGAYYNLGHALVELQRLEEAIAAYQHAIDCDANHHGARVALIHQRRHVCDWRDFDAELAQLRALLGHGEVTPFHALVSFDEPDVQARCAQRASQQAAHGARVLPPRAPERRDRIRVGYLSSDFRRHPVAWLISEVIERHDRTRFDVVAYSHGVDDRSPERARLVRAFDRFVEIRAADHERAAARIRADGIDILVDLNGHTLGARTGILARRPAPVQAAWLGYPGAMGAEYIDYVLGDPCVTPASLQAHFSERIVQLPGCFQPCDTHKAVAEPGPSRETCGLPADGFVFCCFNNAYKLTPAVFGVWMRLLAQLPDAVLWLLETGTPARANLQREAATRGIAAERLVFAQRAPLSEYLARLRLADLFLDTLPYNAGTTANDALWAGLPVLTCAGRCMAARMAGSHLHTAGLPELVTTSLADYEARALALARDANALAALRQRVAAARAGPLFDSARFTRGLEQAYQHMWELCLAGRAPEAFAVPR